MTTTNSAPRPDQLEQLSDSTPSQPTTSSVSTLGNVSVAQETSFVNAISGSVRDTTSCFPPQQLSLSETIYLSTDIPVLLGAPNPSTGPISNLCAENAFSFGPEQVHAGINNDLLQTSPRFQAQAGRADEF